MFDWGFVVLLAVLAGVLGLVLGIALHRGVSNAETRVRQLTRALEQANARNEDYQQQVAQHFSETARMLNDLTEKYKDIHQHLALGADQLCRDELGQSLLTDSPSNSTRSATQQAASNLDSLQPPLDYAPKSDAAQTGTLAEDYGLEKINLSEQPTAENGETLDNDTPSAKAI